MSFFPSLFFIFLTVTALLPTGCSRKVQVVAAPVGTSVPQPIGTQAPEMPESWRGNAYGTARYSGGVGE